VWMIEGGNQPCLGREPFAYIGVGGERSRELFDRDVATELGVTAGVDDPERSASQFAGDVVCR